MTEEKKKKKERKIDKVKIYKKERDEYLEGWKRAKADLLNYKKDEFKRETRILNREKENIFKKILFVLDNFNRAEEEIEKREESDELIEGFLKIKEQIECFLKEEGVEEMNSIGGEFDPFYHDAVEVVEESSAISGKIIEELQKGYLYKGEVLRPAKVKVVK